MELTGPRLLVVAILLICCFSEVRLHAESDVALTASSDTLEARGENSCQGCLFWSSRKKCCWYLLGEVGLGTFILGYPKDEFGEGPKVELVTDGGYMRRLTAKTDIGGTLYFAYDNESARFGVKPRIRYWLRKNIALDVSPGVLFPVMDGDGDGIGYMVSGSVSVNSLLVVGVQYENYTPYTISRYTRTGIATIYLKLGSYLGSIAGLLIVGLGAIAGAGS